MYDENFVRRELTKEFNSGLFWGWVMGSCTTGIGVIIFAHFLGI